MSKDELQQALSPHFPLPEFSDLEIRGTWTGKLHDPASLRITFEVQCIPNMQLQVLDARSENVSLQNPPSASHEPTDESPPSPLFNFSSPTFDEVEQGSATGSGSNDTRPKSEPQTEMPSSHLDNPAGLSDNADDDGDFTDKDSSFPSPPLRKSSPKLAFAIAKCQDWGDMQNLGKRSATEACLSDSESEGANRKSASRGAVKKGTVVRSADEVIEAEEPDTDQPQNLSNSPQKHSRKPSLIPRRAFPAEISESNQSLLTQSNNSLINMEDKGLLKNENLATPETINDTAARQKMGCHHSFSSAISESQLNTRGIDNFITQTSGTEIDVTKDQIEADADQKGTARNLLIPVDSDEECPVGMADSVTTLSTRIGLRELILPFQKDTPEAIDYASKCLLVHEYHGYEPCEPSETKPTLNLVDGILMVKTLPDIEPATYRITFNVNIYLEKEQRDGWTDLIVPGLPNLKAGESGLFALITPGDCPIDFDVNFFAYHRTRENCFLAIFFHDGSRDLIVPMSVGRTKAFSTVKGLPIDQEITAERVIDITLDREGEISQTDVVVKYKAVCSVQFPNGTYHLAERCCFHFYVDGGPPGTFFYGVDPKRKTLPVIELDSRNKSSGVSHVQLFCSPMHLDMFCVTWEVRLPRKKLHLRLPRLHSVPFERKRSHMQNLLASLHDREEGVHDGFEPAEEVDREYDDYTGDERHGQEDTEPDGHPEKDTQTPHDKTGSNYSLTEEKDKAPVANHFQAPGASRKQVFFVVLCVMMKIWSIVAVSKLSPPFLDILERVHTEINLNASSTFNDLYLKGTCPPCTGKPLHESQPNQDNTAEQLGGPEILESQLTTHRKDQYDGLLNNVQSEKQVSAEGHSKERASDEAGNPQTASQKPSNSSSRSFRDKIDYWLGWKGPVGLAP